VQFVVDSPFLLDKSGDVNLKNGQYITLSRDKNKQCNPHSQYYVKYDYNNIPSEYTTRLICN